MTNHNPTLILGQVQSWLLSQGHDIPEHQLRDIEVRVYDAGGAGYFFVRGHHANRWYHKDAPEDSHFTQSTSEDLQRAIDNQCRVQIVGFHGKSYGVWSAWSDFEKEILK